MAHPFLFTKQNFKKMSSLSRTAAVFAFSRAATDSAVAAVAIDAGFSHCADTCAGTTGAFAFNAVRSHTSARSIAIGAFRSTAAAGT